jgi:hypothetical protein
MATRTLYAGQLVKIVANSNTYYLPVSQASCEVSRPIEFITTFGHINNVAAAQNNFTTCKASIKAYLQMNTGLTAAAIADMTGDAVRGLKSVISVTPNGFIMSGVITSLGIDASFGSFATADLSFNGLGEPFFDTGAAGSSVPPDQASAPSAIIPVVSTNIGGAITGAGCSNSFKFSLDLPNEPLACLGDPVTGSQTNITNSVLVTKFPLKSSLSLEGYGVDASSYGELQNSGAWIGTAITGNFNVGGLNIRLPNPKVTSKSFNQAVGNVGATYNISAEDVMAFFS